MTSQTFVEMLMARGFKVREVELISEARAGDRHSTVMKQETTVIAEGLPYRPRVRGEDVHLRETEGNPVCIMCGGPAGAWYDSREKWAKHVARCVPIEPEG